MSRITEIRVGFGRTIVPPGGDRYQPIRLDGSVCRSVEEDDDAAEVLAQAQTELRHLLEETYRVQYKGKDAQDPGQQPAAPAEPPAPTQPFTGFRPAAPAAAAAANTRELVDEPLEY